MSRNGVVRVEVTELFQEQVSQSGLKLSVRSLEIGQWRTALRAVNQGDTRTDLQLTAVAKLVLDSSRAI